LKRTEVAHFLLGFFALPVCALLGGMEALLFHWKGGRAWLCIAFFALFPLAGAIRSRQRTLTYGLIAGAFVTSAAYFALR
jgi:hypothetical protein